MDHRIQTNKDKWNQTFKSFEGWCALPTWGPLGIGADDPTLIGDIQGKTFVEVCCGSGHSIKYLLDNGAQKVYALDFSEAQLDLAKKLNADHLKEGKVEFFCQPMEEPLLLSEPVDVVFSIFGIGWTTDPRKTFKNMYSYLKPEGRFIWSWDNTIFTDSSVDGDKIILQHSYNDESEIRVQSKTGGEVYITYRKVSTWFRLLRETGFVVNRFLEPTPTNLQEDIVSIAGPAMAQYYQPKKVEMLSPVMIFESVRPK